MSEPRNAVLVDVDGTHVDSNYFHTVAWWRAFQQAGDDSPCRRSTPLSGWGQTSRPARLPKARELLVELADRGPGVVLATSSKESDLKRGWRSSGPARR